MLEYKNVESGASEFHVAIAAEPSVPDPQW